MSAYLRPIKRTLPERPFLRSEKRRRAYHLTGGCCWYCGVFLCDDTTTCFNSKQSRPKGGFIYRDTWYHYDVRTASFAMECDHQLPRARGGTDLQENLVPACTSCNAAKGKRTVEEYREWLAVRHNMSAVFYGERIGV